MNEKIRAPKIRLVDPDEGQIGVLTREEALKIAKEKSLDLVEVAPGSKPPVVKLIDFAKFKYDEAKKKKAKKGSSQDTKTLRLRPFMDEHDLNIKLRKIEKFIKKGNRVKLQIRFFGREITKKEFGFELIKKTASALDKSAKLHGQPKLKGRAIEALIVPK